MVRIGEAHIQAILRLQIAMVLSKIDKKVYVMNIFNLSTKVIAGILLVLPLYLHAETLDSLLKKEKQAQEQADKERAQEQKRQEDKEKAEKQALYDNPYTLEELLANMPSFIYESYVVPGSSHRVGSHKLDNFEINSPKLELFDLKYFIDSKNEDKCWSYSFSNVDKDYSKNIYISFYRYIMENNNVKKAEIRKDLLHDLTKSDDYTKTDFTECRAASENSKSIVEMMLKDEQRYRVIWQKILDNRAVKMKAINKAFSDCKNSKEFQLSRIIDDMGGALFSRNFNTNARDFSYKQGYKERVILINKDIAKQNQDIQRLFTAYKQAGGTAKKIEDVQQISLPNCNALIFED